MAVLPAVGDHEGELLGQLSDPDDAMETLVPVLHDDLSVGRVLAVKGLRSQLEKGLLTNSPSVTGQNQWALINNVTFPYLVDVNRGDGTVLLVHWLGLGHQVKLPTADVNFGLPNGVQVHIYLDTPASEFQVILKQLSIVLLQFLYLDASSHPGSPSGSAPPSTGVMRL